MSKSKSRTVTFIQGSGDVESVKEDNGPLDVLDYNSKKVSKGKPFKRERTSLSCSIPSATDFIDLGEERLESKDDSHKHIYVNKLPYGKNSRKSRTGIKEHKKGGGGKGIWNNHEPIFGDLNLDKNDPSYESDEDSVNYEMKTHELSEEQFDDAVTNWIKEYFENCEASEVVRNLEETYLTQELSLRIPYICIVQALQRKPAQCELTSRLLSELIGKVINEDDMVKGLDLVIKEMSELTIDCPEAPEIVGKFIARAIADDLLPPKYIQSHKIIVDNDDQMKAFAKAENLLSLNHAYARLDTVWGSPGGERPTKMLIHKIRILLAEYLDSDDEVEAGRCLQELEAPHFHHELVFQAMLMVLEKSTEFVCNKMIKLLESLWKSVIITIDQFDQGINRIYTQMNDIQLDVPAAYILLERFVSLAMTNGTFFSNQLGKRMPKNIRARFLSEGGDCFIRRPMDLD